MPARRDRPDEHAITDFVPGDAGAELRDDADRLMPDDQPRPDRILTFDDMQVRPAVGMTVFNRPAHRSWPHETKDRALWDNVQIGLNGAAWCVRLNWKN